ncbi:PIN domain-containing protein [Duganella sp. FT80W]|uniref:Ribonuclease VapC n=2 Tax=Duganella guangzhouensis TaxID=2666084 RepID=A0A6I2KZ45_9BURK|nr:type II toxin-antitoxin system VapC family toxin [Duganella guangzhouensis]MRW89526.1 PIN domain-containing protein [Duganella guangzhouensis]
MVILDTNVISELRKVALGKANANVAKWARHMEANTLYLSAITIHEIESGILRLKRRNDFSSEVLRLWLDNHVLKAFAGRILPVDTAVAQRTAALHLPQTRPWADAFIAATALVHGMVVATRNARDFQPMGVPVLNPWL